MKKRFGLRVQELRRRKDITQQELADAIDRSLDTIGNIETGRALTRIDTAERLANALDVDLPELFEFPEQPVRGDKQRRRLIDQMTRILSKQDLEVLEAIARAVEELANIAGRAKR